MSVYNNAETLEQSIRCILAQDFSDFELLVYDDGSRDTTASIVSRLAEEDSRIVLLCGDGNHGLSYGLNRCLSVATGEYCARMDGDDLCDVDRFSKQFAFLEAHPEYGFVSTTMKRFDEHGFYDIPPVADGYSPTERDFVKGSPFCHAPVMMRLSAYRAVDGYRDIPATKGVEDYDLWFRLYAVGIRGYILNEPLYSMFDGRDAGKRRTFRRRVNESKVRANGYRMLRLPFFYRIYVLKPLLLGLLPQWLYRILHKR